MRSIRRLRDSWNSFGKSDAQLAVLTDVRGRTQELEDFFASGRAEVDVAFELARLNDWNLQTHTALDYGCGIGRVTQALAERFDDARGVDIAPSMIEQARQLNRYPKKCHYQLNAKGDLDGVPTNYFDFVFCKIVLQHMGADLAAQRIKGLVACLRPEGLLVFQMPSELVGRKPLADGSFRAAIDDVSLPTKVEANSTISVHARVKNVSTETWPAGNDAAVAAGCYWTRSGARTELPEGRMFLRDDLKPGDDMDATLDLPTPSKPGRYELVIDVVQEGVTWFGDHGSDRCVRAVVVEGDPPRRSFVKLVQRVARKVLRKRPYEMIMDGIPRRQVEVLLAGVGAAILLVQQDRAAPEWESYTYWVTKPAPR